MKALRWLALSAALLSGLGALRAGERVLCSNDPELCIPDTLAIRFGDATQRISSVRAGPGEILDVTVAMDVESAGILSWSYGVAHDPTKLELLSATTEGTDARAIMNVGIDSVEFAEGSPCPGFVSAVILSFSLAVHAPLGQNFTIARARYRVIAALSPADATPVWITDTLNVPGAPATEIQINFDDIWERLPQYVVDGEVSGAFATARAFCSPPAACSDDALAVVFDSTGDSAVWGVRAGQRLEASVALDVRSTPIEGFSFGLRHDPAILGLTPAALLGRPNPTFRGAEPLVENAVYSSTQPAATGDGFVAAVILDFHNLAHLPPGRLGYRLLRVAYDVIQTPSSPSTVSFTDELNAQGSPATDVVLVTDGPSKCPGTVHDGLLSAEDTRPCNQPDFAYYFGRSATSAVHDCAGSSRVSVSLRNTRPIIAFQLGIKKQGDRLEFSGSLGADPTRIVELLVTDENANSVDCPGPNSARGAPAAPIAAICRGAAATGHERDFFFVDLDPQVGGPGATVGYIVDMGTPGGHVYETIPAVSDASWGCAAQEILVLDFTGSRDVLSSSDPASALPIGGSLQVQIDAANAGPPPYDAFSWLPVHRRNDARRGPFSCAAAGDPLGEPYVDPEQFLLDSDEITLDNCGSAFYRFTFVLPEGFAAPCLSGVANVDDVAAVYLNGRRISGEIPNPGCSPDPAAGPGDPCYALQAAGADPKDSAGLRVLTWPTMDPFGTCSPALFRTGENELVFAVVGDASFWEPTGLEFSAFLRYDGAGPLPDLAVTDVEAPPRAVAEDDVEITWKVTNSGARPAGHWVDRVLLSRDGVPGQDIVLGEAYQGAPLEAGSTVLRSASFHLAAAPGEYRVRVETDARSEVSEISETSGNALLDDATIQIDPMPLPDLVVTRIVPPVDGALAGRATDIEFRVENRGESPSRVSSWKDTAVLVSASGDPACLLPTSAARWQSDSPGALSSGAGYTTRRRVTLPSYIEGSFRIAVYADSAQPYGACWPLGGSNDVPEADERNNVVLSDAFSIEVPPQPDLFVPPGSITFFPEAFSATRFQVCWVVANVGDATVAASWHDAVYLSADAGPGIGAGDLLLGRISGGSVTLAKGESTDLRCLEAVLPADLHGELHVKVLADCHGEVTEYGLEGNNVSAGVRTVTVVLSPAVDLEPAELTVPSEIIPGHPFEVSWKVENVGAPPQDLARVWSDALYLSEDKTLDPAADRLLGGYGQSTGTDELGRPTLTEYGGRATYWLSRSAPEKDHYVIIQVDRASQVYEGTEGGEGNNVLVSGPMRAVRKPKDLVVVLKEPLPSSAAVTQPFEVSWTVTNAGLAETPVSYWRDRVYLSTDSSLGAGDILLATADRRSPLASGGSYSVVRSAVAPPVAHGAYFILVVTDADDDVYEDPPGEGNNVDRKPFSVTDDAADLQVTELQGPASAKAGDSIAIAWRVRNSGTLRTPTNFWSDAVFLSRDDRLDGADVQLGSIVRGDYLEPGEEYRDLARGTLFLPRSLSGAYRVIVVADAWGQVYESQDQNNFRVAEAVLSVGEFRPPRLAVAAVQVEGEVVAGQTIRVRWTVENTGDGPTGETRWWDSVYLSHDASLDPSEDVYLGGVEHVGALGPKGSPQSSYEEEETFDVPAGVTGQYFVIVGTDRQKAVPVEGGREESVGLDPTPKVVLPPEPCDLAVASIEVPAPEIVGGAPAPATIGEEVTVRWWVGNLGGGDTPGRWEDALYLSADEAWDLDDALLGRASSRPPAPLPEGGAPAELEATFRVPGVEPGAYHVVVRTDFLNQVPEIDERNNLGASAETFEVAARSLELGQPLSEVLRSGEEKCFEFTAPEGETVQVTLDHSSAGAWTELLVRQGRVPTLGQYDHRSEEYGAPDQKVIIPDTQAGKYYLLVRATQGTFPGEGETMTLLAEILPFSVLSAAPEKVGDAGRVSLTVLGSQLRPGARVRLESSSPSPAVSREARRVVIASGARLVARFVLDGLARRTYDLVVRNPDGETKVLRAAVTVQAAMPPVLEVTPVSPPALREGASGGTLDFEVRNSGNIDADYIVLEEAMEEIPGREILGLTASGLWEASFVREGFLVQSALVRSVAPGSTAAMSTTLRAGLGSAGGIPVAHGVSALTTEEFLDFSARAAEAVRVAVLEDAGTVLEERRAEVLRLAGDGAAWRQSWLWNLAAAGYLDAEDVPEFPGGPPGLRGAAACPPPADPDFPWLREEAPVVFCGGWADGLVEMGVAACGLFASSPRARAAPMVGCVPGEIAPCCFLSLWPVKRPEDPNEKTGPEGVGDESFVPKKAIRYRVHFENVPTASAPAAVVEIRDPLDPSVKPGSFRPQSIAFGDKVVSIPAGSMSFQERLDMRETDGIFLNMVTGVDAERREAFWILRSIDPSTGWVPSTALSGFLRPNDATGRGQGWVEFTVEPEGDGGGAAGAIEIRNYAVIRFDSNEPLRTEVVKHTLDPEPPTSSVSPIASGASGARGSTVSLRWSARDAEGGSGLAGTTVYVSKDDGPYVPFVSGTMAESADLPVEGGHWYAFYSVATDRAGNVEKPPEEPDATLWLTRFRRGDSNADGKVNISDPIATLGFLFLGSSDVRCSDGADATDDGKVNISDPIFVLNYLFLGGPAPASPGADACGADPTPDDISDCRYLDELCQE